MTPLRGPSMITSRCDVSSASRCRSRARAHRVCGVCRREARADYVTTDARPPAGPSPLPHVTPATVNGRFQMIRRFAQWRQLTDPRTKSHPPTYCPVAIDDTHLASVVRKTFRGCSMAARHLPSSKGLRGRTYATLFGLLAVTGLRSSEVVALDDADLDRREATCAFVAPNSASRGSCRCTPPRWPP